MRTDSLSRWGILFYTFWLETMSVRGYFFALSKRTFLLSLRMLLLVPAGLPVHSQGDSQSDNKVMDNITVRQGETVFLRWVDVSPVRAFLSFSILSSNFSFCLQVFVIAVFAVCSSGGTRPTLVVGGAVTVWYDNTLIIWSSVTCDLHHSSPIAISNKDTY